MNPLAQKYVTEIEGFIPDLCMNEELPDDEPGRQKDAVQDFTGDYITDREPNGDAEQIRDAAREIAEYYFG